MKTFNPSGASANWDNDAAWGGAKPVDADEVTIAAGKTCVINCVTAIVASIIVNGTLTVSSSPGDYILNTTGNLSFGSAGLFTAGEEDEDVNFEIRVSTAVVAATPDIDFNVEDHRSFINRRGESLYWWKSVACPCKNTITQLHNHQCSLCLGSGIIFTKQTITNSKALIRQVDEKKDYTKYGQVLVGDITVTTMPDEIPLGPRDKIELIERTFMQETVIKASGTSADILPFPRVASLINVQSTTKAYSLVAVGQTAAEVTLNSLGDGLQWVVPPAQGTSISVSYNRIPMYFCLPEFITTRRTVGGVKMPQRIVARRLDTEDFKE